MGVTQKANDTIGPERGAYRTLVALAGAAAVMLLALGACNTPFIPLPPPDDPTFTQVMTPDATARALTSWEARGGPNAVPPMSKIFIWNLALKVGVIGQAGPDGAYVASPFDGQPGDQIELRYETPKGEESQVKCRILGAGVAGAPCPR